MRLPHVQGDLSRINVDPAALPKIRERWQPQIS
jgi:hypothetical protein